MSETVSSIAEMGSQSSFLIGKHMEATMRRLLKGDSVETTGEFLRLLSGLPHPLGNFVFFSESSNAELTQKAIEPLKSCGAPSSAIFCEQASTLVNKTLEESGYEAHMLPTMAIDIDKLAISTLPDGYEFVQARSSDESDRWTDALTEGYGLPRELSDMFSPNAIGLEVAQCYGIQKEGKMVATSMLHLHDGLAGIYCVATLPEERGKGLGAHVTAEPLRIAAALGYRVGVLQSSSDGHPVYLRLGFVECGVVPFYARMPE